jgi:Tfp pilus assembly protein PilZ
MRTKEELGFKRIHERKTYAKEVVFSHNDKAYAGQIKNISLGGAFISTRSVNQFSPGDTITLSIPFTTGQKHVKRKGRILWLNNEGIAIEFY